MWAPHPPKRPALEAARPVQSSAQLGLPPTPQWRLGVQKGKWCPQVSYRTELVDFYPPFGEEFVSGRDFASEKRQVINFGEQTAPCGSAGSAIHRDVVRSVVAPWSVHTAIVGGWEVEGGESPTLTVLLGRRAFRVGGRRGLLRAQGLQGASGRLCCQRGPSSWGLVGGRATVPRPSPLCPWGRRYLTWPRASGLPVSGLGAQSPGFAPARPHRSPGTCCSASVLAPFSERPPHRVAAACSSHLPPAGLVCLVPFPRAAHPLRARTLS